MLQQAKLSTFRDQNDPQFNLIDRINLIEKSFNDISLCFHSYTRKTMK